MGPDCFEILGVRADADLLLRTMRSAKEAAAFTADHDLGNNARLAVIQNELRLEDGRIKILGVAETLDLAGQ